MLWPNLLISRAAKQLQPGTARGSGVPRECYPPMLLFRVPCLHQQAIFKNQPNCPTSLFHTWQFPRPQTPLCKGLESPKLLAAQTHQLPIPLLQSKELCFGFVVRLTASPTRQTRRSLRAGTLTWGFRTPQTSAGQVSTWCPPCIG